MTQFTIDVSLPLPATCPDCGAAILAHADIEGPGDAGPAGVQRDANPEGVAMTLRFIVTHILGELIELAERDGVVVGRDQVPVGEEAPA